MNESITNIQDQIIQMLFEKVNGEEWFEIVVNFEALETEGTLESSSVSFFVTKKSNSYEKGRIKLSFHDKKLIQELRKEYSLIQEPWSILDIRISRSGKFSFDLSYANPKRLSGQIESGFEDYLINYEPPE